MGGGFALLVFVGTFEGGSTYGTFSAQFRLLVDTVEKIEMTTKTPYHLNDRIPAWVPQNCEPLSVSPEGTRN